MKISSKLSHAPARFVYPVLGVLGIWVLLAAGSAQAAPVTFGQLAPLNPPAYCINGPNDNVPTGTATATYSVPTAGVITSWSTNAAAGEGQTLTFKVYRPLESGKYLVVGHDGPRTLTPSNLNTFKTSIPVQAGDVIGNDDDNAKSAPNACLFETKTASDHLAYATGEAADGATITTEGEEEEGVRPNLTATVLPPPAIASLAPATGPTGGGSPVTITGTNFTEASAVKFGSSPASSFTVNSDTQITATAPPAGVGAVAVSITTPAGTATSTQLFTYAAPSVPITPPLKSACVVPKLAGKTLKAAKKALAKADCKLGKVKGHKTKSAKVKKQSPRPGKVLAPGSKVSVKLR